MSFEVLLQFVAVNYFSSCIKVCISLILFTILSSEWMLGEKMSHQEHEIVLHYKIKGCVEVSTPEKKWIKSFLVKESKIWSKKNSLRTMENASDKSIPAWAANIVDVAFAVTFFTTCHTFTSFMMCESYWWATLWDCDYYYCYDYWR